MRPLRKAGLLRGINTLDSGNKEIICLFHTQRSPFKRRRGGGWGVGTTLAGCRTLGFSQPVCGSKVCVSEKNLQARASAVKTHRSGLPKQGVPGKRTYYFWRGSPTGLETHVLLVEGNFTCYRTYCTLLGHRPQGCPCFALLCNNITAIYHARRSI